MASSLLASTQSSPLPADLLSSSYVIHFSTTWWLHTLSTFRSFFLPCIPCLLSCNAGFNLCVCVCVLASFQGCFFLIADRAQQLKKKKIVFHSFFFRFRILCPLQKIISDKMWFYSIPPFPSFFCLAALALNKLLALKTYALSSLPLPPALHC